MRSDSRLGLLVLAGVTAVALALLLPQGAEAGVTEKVTLATDQSQPASWLVFHHRRHNRRHRRLHRRLHRRHRAPVGVPTSPVAPQAGEVPSVSPTPEQNILAGPGHDRLQHPAENPLLDINTDNMEKAEPEKNKQRDGLKITSDQGGNLVNQPPE